MLVNDLYKIIIQNFFGHFLIISVITDSWNIDHEKYIETSYFYGLSYLEGENFSDYFIYPMNYLGGNSFLFFHHVSFSARNMISGLQERVVKI